MRMYQIFVGFDGAGRSPYRTLRGLCSTHFSNGCTIVRHEGVWQGSIEPGATVSVAAPIEDVTTFADEVCRIMQQDCVLIAQTDTQCTLHGPRDSAMLGHARSES